MRIAVLWCTYSLATKKQAPVQRSAERRKTPNPISTDPEGALCGMGCGSFRTQAVGGMGVWGLDGFVT